MAPPVYLLGAGSHPITTLQKMNPYLIRSATSGLVLPSFALYPTILISTLLSFRIFVSLDWWWNTYSVLQSPLHAQTWCRMPKNMSLSHTSQHFTNRCELLLCLQVMVEIAPISGQESTLLLTPSPQLCPGKMRSCFILSCSDLLSILLQVSRSHIARHQFSCFATRYTAPSPTSLHILLICLPLSHR